MAKKPDQRTTFTKEALRKLAPAATEYVVWDDGYRGFGALGCRVSPKGVKTLFTTYRAGASGAAKQVKTSVMRVEELLRREELTMDALRRGVARRVDEARETGLTPKEAKRRAEAKRVWTLEEVARDYLAAKQTPYADGGAAFELFLRRCREAKIADLPITEVKVSHIRQVVKPLKPAAKRQARAVISPWFTHAMDQLEIEGLTRNPCRAIEVPGYKPRTTVLSEDEMAVFDAALDEYERTAEQKSDVAVEDRCDALRLIAYVGLRKMVVLGARWSEFSDLDVDPIVWTVTVEPGRAKNGEKLVVSLAPEAADILRRIRVRRDQQGGWLREHQHVFPSRTAKGGHLLEIRQTFDNVVRLAGLEDKGLHLHDLRATWITAAVENGAKPEIVAAQVGHKNATVTLSVYNRIRASKEEKASVAGAAVSAYKRRVETAE